MKQIPSMHGRLRGLHLRFSFCLGALALGAGLLAGFAVSGAESAPVVFHVKPGGVAPFSSRDEAVRPQLNRPGKPNWATGGIEPGFWLSGKGSADQPFATVYQAQLAVRELLRTRSMLEGGVKVIVHGGVYRMEAPLFFVPADSGRPGSPIVYEAAPGEAPVLSGGVKVVGWEKRDAPGLPEVARGRVWAAPAPRIGGRVLEFRQLYVNGAKAVRARTPNVDAYQRLAKWDIPNRQALAEATNVAPWRNLQQVELVLQQSWAISYLRLDSITNEGDKARLTFQEPERTLSFSHPYPWPRNNAPYHFVNAIEFLDEPGEWYLDLPSGMVYYWPRPGEEMMTAEVMAPRLEMLVRIQGSLDQPVHDLEFHGIGFEHATWMRPSLMGLVPLQAGQYFEHPGYRIQGGVPEAPGLDNQDWAARPPAAVYLAGADRIRFAGCAFRHTGSAALDLHYGASEDEVIGCRFEDIGGNGVQLGKFSEDGLEAHLPYKPSDKRELCSRDRIANSYFRDCGSEDWGCAGIAAGFPRALTVEHNELTELPYSGISIGWGWTPLGNAMRDNRILFNRVHNYMRRLGDGGAIYLLSNQKDSEIRGNYVYDLRQSPVGDAGCMIYLDEGSSGILVKDNLTDQDKFIRNRNGSGNRWENTGTNGPAELKDKAGIEQPCAKVVE
jgi:hypothetical protein